METTSSPVSSHLFVRSLLTISGHCQNLGQAFHWGSNGGMGGMGATGATGATGGGGGKPFFAYEIRMTVAPAGAYDLCCLFEWLTKSAPRSFWRPSVPITWLIWIAVSLAVLPLRQPLREKQIHQESRVAPPVHSWHQEAAVENRTCSQSHQSFPERASAGTISSDDPTAFKWSMLHWQFICQASVISLANMFWNSKPPSSPSFRACSAAWAFFWSIVTICHYSFWGGTCWPLLTSLSLSLSSRRCFNWSQTWTARSSHNVSQCLNSFASQHLSFLCASGVIAAVTTARAMLDTHSVSKTQTWLSSFCDSKRQWQKPRLKNVSSVGLAQNKKALPLCLVPLTALINYIAQLQKLNLKYSKVGSVGSQHWAGFSL